MTNTTLKNSIKEKDRRVKELKVQLSKMEKSLSAAKKIFDEKTKKNESYIKENDVINFLILEFELLTSTKKFNSR